MIISHLLELLSKVYFKEFENSFISGYASFINDLSLVTKFAYTLYYLGLKKKNTPISIN